MKIALIPALLLPCSLLLAQDPDLFEKAPPEIDQALRSRVMIFFNAHITQKYRAAMQVVAEDAQDDFLGAEKPDYKSCEIAKINYEDNFRKATVTTACKGVYRWHGQQMPVTIPSLSHWKFVDGKWWWYRVREKEVLTPWGMSTVGAATPENPNPPSLPADPMAAAQSILNLVSIDKQALQLKGYEASKGEVRVTNNMPGSVTVTVDRMPLAGLTAKVEKSELGVKESTAIVFSYDPNDPAIACNECTLKVALPTLTANVRVLPTGQVFPVTITFAVPPELQKLLPKQ